MEIDRERESAGEILEWFKNPNFTFSKPVFKASRDYQCLSSRKLYCKSFKIHRENNIIYKGNIKNRQYNNDMIVLKRCKLYFVSKLPI